MNTKPRHVRRRRGLRLLALVTGLAALTMGLALPAQAHGPDPRLGGSLWAPNQDVTYTWKSGQAPPTWMIPAIDAAAADATRSRASQAATFRRATGAPSLVAYGEPTGCSAVGIACFSRAAAPTSFSMWFRAQGYAFDWGKLRWCQAPSGLADGCFDVENVALDEFGHVEVLEHHATLADGSDYLDAVVQAASRARPKPGWDAHALGRCDTARLQLEYERPGPSSLFSTCLALPTTLALTAWPTSLAYGGTSTFTADLRVAVSSAARALSGDPISGRVVMLQRRAPGTSPWTSVVQMTPSGSTAGRYTASWSPTATYEWRAAFATPVGEGIIGSASAVSTITVAACTSACPTAVSQ